MSDTPRTDALERKAAGTPLVYCDAFDLARRLERERAELIAALAQIARQCASTRFGKGQTKENAMERLEQTVEQARAVLSRVKGE